MFSGKSRKGWRSVRKLRGFVAGNRAGLVPFYRWRRIRGARFTKARPKVDKATCILDEGNEGEVIRMMEQIGFPVEG